jgi:hypothetical protein
MKKKGSKSRERSRELKANRIMLNRDPLVESLTEVRSMLDGDAVPIVPDLSARIEEGGEPASSRSIPGNATAAYATLKIMHNLGRNSITLKQRKDDLHDLKTHYEKAKKEGGIECDDHWVTIATAVEDYATAARICLKLSRFCDAEQYLVKSGMAREDVCRMLGEFCEKKGFNVYAASFFRKAGKKESAEFCDIMRAWGPALTEAMKQDARKD